MTSRDEDDQSRTPAEQRMIDEVARNRGEEWAEKQAELILTQARLVGELPDVEANTDADIRNTLRTLVEWARDDDEARKPALQLARHLLSAYERVPDGLAEALVVLLTGSGAGPDGETHWMEADYAPVAARCIAQLAEKDPGVTVEAVPQLANAAESDDIRTRQWSMYSFAKIAANYPEEVLPAVDVLVGGVTAELLERDDPKIRANAAGSLGDLATGHPDTVIDYSSDVARLLTDDDPEVRRNASITLLRAGEADPAAVRAEHEQLEAALDDDDPEVRANVCALIANSRAPVSKARLRELRSDDPEETVRDRATWALNRSS